MRALIVRPGKTQLYPRPRKLYQPPHCFPMCRTVTLPLAICAGRHQVPII